MTINYGRLGMYGGQKVFFTHRNPKTGAVWSDEIKYPVKKTELTPKGKITRVVTEYGKWVSPDKVTWL